MVNFAEYQLRKKQKALEEKQQQQKPNEKPKEKEEKDHTKDDIKEIKQNNNPISGKQSNFNATNITSSTSPIPKDRPTPEIKNNTTTIKPPMMKINLSKLPNGPSSASKQTTSIKLSRSPIAKNTNGNITRSPKRTQVPPQTWPTQFTDFLQSYQSTRGLLPPILSADLPLIYNKISVITNTKRNNSPPTFNDVKKLPITTPISIPKMLSPTLPARYISNSGTITSLGKDRSSSSRIIEDDDVTKLPLIGVSQYKQNYTKRLGLKNEHTLRFINSEYDGNKTKKSQSSNKKKLILKLRFTPCILERGTKKRKIKEKEKVIGLGLQGVGTGSSGSRIIRRIPSDDEDEKEETPQRKKNTHQRSTSLQSSTVTRSESLGHKRTHSNPVSSIDSTVSNMELLKNSSDRFVKLAKLAKKTGDFKEQQYDSSPESDLFMLEAIVNYIDCVIIYIVAFNHDQHAKRIEEQKIISNNTSYTEKRWVSLITFIDFILRTIQDYKQTKTPTDCSYDISHLSSLSNQLKAIIATHITTILTSRITFQQSQRDNDELMVDVKNLIKYTEMAKECLAQGDISLDLWSVMKDYPHIYDTFRKNHSRCGTKVSSNDDIIIISEDEEVMRELRLPITQAVSLSEITKYAELILKLWSQERGFRFKSRLFERD